ncbi:MAG: TAXI family TRAP transporter solute-binding subunit [Desulfobacterales bacterium]|nr:TAXI family TRAP transporter solute-binding subunit [Desulfobacterales bacterium]
MKQLNLSRLAFMLVLSFILVPSMALAADKSSPQHPVTEIKIYSFIKGTSVYALSFALTDLLSKHSTWLRATAISTHGSGQNIKTLAMKPELRNHSIAFSPAVIPYRVMKGKEPFDKPWTTIRALLKLSGASNAFITLDPNIKKPEDLRGKKIGLPRKGTDGEYYAVNILKYGWGITEKDAVFQFLGWEESRDALRDGLVDAAYMLTGSSSSAPWIMVPAFQELVATKPPYFIDISKETISKATKATGDPIDWVKAPPKVYGPNQTEPTGVAALQLCFWADASLPSAVVKELLRIFTDHNQEFGKYHPSGRLIKVQELGSINWPAELFHPAAIEFYKERNIPIGLK